MSCRLHVQLRLLAIGACLALSVLAEVASATGAGIAPLRGAARAATDGVAWERTTYPQFAAFTESDFRQLAGMRVDFDAGGNGPRVPTAEELAREGALRIASEVELPEAFDARERWPGSVHEAADQGNCGSCWAISASGVLADRLFIASGGAVDVRLSPEYIISCDYKGDGCHGGELDQAWGFLQQRGAPVDACYPYKERVLACPKRCVAGSGATMDRFHADLIYRLVASEEQGVASIMCDLFERGPVQTGYTMYEDFMHYKGGVYYKTTDQQKNYGWHAVKIVGWGVENGVPYWTVQNSWGTWWGDKGYFKIRRGTNECGIETYVYAGTARLPAAAAEGAGPLLVGA